MIEYITLKGRGESLLIEKKSRFIGHAAPVSSKEEALSFIESIRNEYKDASCNATAYNIRTGNLTHSSDDGEPSGTAGLPALETLVKANIVDAVVVVTRYYGGTPLGAGGLIRAYSSTASAALRDATVVLMTQCVVYDVTTPYSEYNRLLQLLESMKIIIRERDFLDKVILSCVTKKDNEENFIKELTEFFRGDTEISFINEEFLPLEIS